MVVLSDALRAVLDDAAAREQGGDRAGAIAVLDGAREAHAASALFHYARGAVLVRAGRVDDGIAALTEAAGIEPDVPEVQANLGAALLERAQRRGPAALSSAESQADVARALELLTGAAKAKPMLADVHANHGRALALTGRVPEALAAYERALALDGRHVPALYGQAAALHLAGRDADALVVLDALLAIAPGFEPAVRSRENTLRRLGRG